MDFPQSHYYKLNQLELRIMGQWPYQNSLESKIRRLVTYIILWGSTLFEIIKLIKKHSDFDFVIDEFPELTMLFGAAICMILLYPGWEVYSELMDRVRTDWKQLIIKEEIKIKETYAEKGKLLTTTLTAYAFGIYMPVILVTKFFNIFYYNRDSTDLSQLINATDYEPEINNTMYRFILLFQIYTMFMATALFIVANSLIFVSYVYHVCGMFAVVGYRLEHLIYKDQSTVQNKEMNRRAYRAIKSCIKMHREAIQFTTILETHYIGCLFIIVSFIIGMFSVTLLQIIDMQTLHFKSLIFCGGQLFFFSLLSYMGQKMVDSCLNVADYAYNGLWYEGSINLQKLILLIIQRSNTPIIFNSSKSFILTIENFGIVRVIRSAISFCMVLRNLR